MMILVLTLHSWESKLLLARDGSHYFSRIDRLQGGQIEHTEVSRRAIEFPPLFRKYQSMARSWENPAQPTDS